MSHREHTQVQVVWLKRDLRLEDHPAFTAAAQRGPIVALILYEPSLWEAADSSGRHAAFYRETLEPFLGQCRAAAIPCVVERGRGGGGAGLAPRSARPGSRWAFCEALGARAGEWPVSRAGGQPRGGRTDCSRAGLVGALRCCSSSGGEGHFREAWKPSAQSRPKPG